MLEGLSGRIKYQYLQQRSDIDHLFTASGPITTVPPTNVVQYYFSAYDIANYDQNMVKLVLDWNPMPLLDIGIGATWKKTDYKDPRTTAAPTTSARSTMLRSATASRQVPRVGDRQLGQGQVRSGLPPDIGSRSDSADLPRRDSEDPPNSSTSTGARRTPRTNWMVALQADWVASEKLQSPRRRAGSTPAAASTSRRATRRAPAATTAVRWSTTSTDDTETKRFLIKATTSSTRHGRRRWATHTRNTITPTTRCAGIRATTRTISTYPGSNNALSSNNSWNTGAYANPSYRTTSSG